MTRPRRLWWFWILFGFRIFARLLLQQELWRSVRSVSNLYEEHHVSPGLRFEVSPFVEVSVSIDTEGLQIRLTWCFVIFGEGGEVMRFTDCQERILEIFIHLSTPRCFRDAELPFHAIGGHIG